MITNTNSKNCFSVGFDHPDVIQASGQSLVFQIQVSPKNFSHLFMVNYFAPSGNSDGDFILHQEVASQHARVAGNQNSKASYSDFDLLNTTDTKLEQVVNSTKAFGLVIISKVAKTIKEYSSVAGLDFQ